MDQLEAWCGLKRLWEIEIPPEAEIRLAGKRIFAVTKTEKGIYIKELFPPR